MAFLFLASMQLTCESTSLAVLAEFDKFWTRRLEDSWSALSMKCDRGIEDQLVGVLLNGCRMRISADVGAPVMQAETFEPGAWALDPNGWYVQSRAVRVSTATSTELQPWALQGPNGTEAAICVYGKFRLVEVPDQEPVAAQSGGAK